MEPKTALVYQTDGKTLKSKMINFFDENGKLETTETHNYKDDRVTLESKTSESFDENGKLKSREIHNYKYNGTGLEHATETSESFDENGKLKSRKIHNSKYNETELESKTSESFDENGKLKSTRTYNRKYNGTGLESTTEISESFDENGKLKSREINNCKYNGTELESETSESFDENGKKTVIKFVYGKPIFSCFDNKGKIHYNIYKQTGGDKNTYATDLKFASADYLNYMTLNLGLIPDCYNSNGVQNITNTNSKVLSLELKTTINLYTEFIDVEESLNRSETFENKQNGLYYIKFKTHIGIFIKNGEKYTTVGIFDANIKGQPYDENKDFPKLLKKLGVTSFKNLYVTHNNTHPGLCTMIADASCIVFAKCFKDNHSLNQALRVFEDKIQNIKFIELIQKANDCAKDLGLKRQEQTVISLVKSKDKNVKSYYEKHVIGSVGNLRFSKKTELTEKDLEEMKSVVERYELNPSSLDLMKIKKTPEDKSQNSFLIFLEDLKKEKAEMFAEDLKELDPDKTSSFRRPCVLDPDQTLSLGHSYVNDKSFEESFEEPQMPEKVLQGLSLDDKSFEENFEEERLKNVEVKNDLSLKNILSKSI